SAAKGCLTGLLVLRNGKHDPKSQVEPVIVRDAPAPRCRTAVLAVNDPAAAPPDAGLVAFLEPVRTPFPDVAVHVVKAESIRLEGAYLARPLHPGPFGGAAIRLRPAEVGLLGR